MIRPNGFCGAILYYVGKTLILHRRLCLSQNSEITKLTEIVNFTSIYGTIPVLEIIAVAPHYCIPDSRGPRNLFGTAGDLGQQV